MRRLCRALVAFLTPGSCLTWSTCWRHAKDKPRFQVVARDGFRFVEPVAQFTTERTPNGGHRCEVVVLPRRLSVPQDVQ